MIDYYNYGAEPVNWVVGSQSGGGSQSKEATYLYFDLPAQDGSWRTYITDNMVNMTNLVKLRITWKAVSEPYRCDFGISTDKNIRPRYCSPTRAYFQISFDETVDLDVSSISGNHYIVVGVEGSASAPGWAGQLYVYRISGLQIEPKTMEGTLNTTGALVKKARKLVGLAGILNVVGTFTGYKIFKVLMEGTLIVAGTLSKTAKKVVAGTLNTAGTLIKKVSMTFTGILNVGGAMTKLYRMTIEGTLNVSGSLVKKVKKILAGTLTVAGILSAIKYRLYRITSIAIKAGKGIVDSIKARKVM